MASQVPCKGRRGRRSWGRKAPERVSSSNGETRFFCAHNDPTAQHGAASLRVSRRPIPVLRGRASRLVAPVTAFAVLFGGHIGDTVMAIKPNIGPTWRALYVVLGVVIIAVPFAASMEGVLRIVLPVLGVASLAAGATGW